MEREEIKSLYTSIMMKEKKAVQAIWCRPIYQADEIFNTATRLLEIAKLSLLSRSFNQNYHLSSANIAYESVAAHTNLMSALVDYAISYECDNCIPIEENYSFSYREIMEAVRRHDLPENEIGDIPDDGRRDDTAKAIDEQEYWYKYSFMSPPRDLLFETHVNSILSFMNKRATTIGRLLHVADKASAIIATLRYDLDGYPPVKTFDDKDISEIDRIAMKLCDNQEDGMCKASEMWSIGYFNIRETTKYDDYGFVTGVLVMATLIANGRWYEWRNRNYKNIPHI
ncbi:hypothetical protein IKD98_04180 [Candidatus Saccharibacteria bacterium]|nr:hypothetical protein [Candidatus Saccharibacteria bacterium]